MKVAVTAASVVTAHVPVPLQAPPQPAKDEPFIAAAVSVTLVPRANDAAHVLPQLIPEGFDVTVPEPDPILVTVTE